MVSPTPWTWPHSASRARDVRRRCSRTPGVTVRDRSGRQPATSITGHPQPACHGSIGVRQCRPGVGQPASAHPSPKGRGLTSLRGGVIGGGEEPTGRGFVGGGNQDVNTLDLHLWVLSSGIICRHRCAQAMTAQLGDDQLRLGAAGNDRHRHRRAVHDCNSSAPVTAWRPLLASWSHVGRPVAPVETSAGNRLAVPAPRTDAATSGRRGSCPNLACDCAQQLSTY
jgi:hypothetical protein